VDKKKHDTTYTQPSLESYKLWFLDFSFQEENLKYILQHTLKELKTSTTNEEGEKRNVL